MKKILYTLVALSFLASPVIAQQRVESFKLTWENNNKTVLLFTGDVKKGLVAAIIAKWQESHFTKLIMNSPGGLSYEGSKLSRFIKKTGVSVLIKKGTGCMSACAYAAISSPNLVVNGVIGFHMGYLPEFPQTMSIEKYTKVIRASDLDSLGNIAINNYSLMLYAIILRESSRDVFIVFFDENDLLKFKATNLANLITPPPEYQRLYRVMKSIDVARYLYAQQLEIRANAQSRNLETKRKAEREAVKKPVMVPK